MSIASSHVLNNVIVACDASNHSNFPFPVMSNFVETLDEIENCFLANPRDVSLLVDTLIELGNLIETPMMKLIVDYYFF